MRVRSALERNEYRCARPIAANSPVSACKHGRSYRRVEKRISHLDSRASRSKSFYVLQSIMSKLAPNHGQSRSPPAGLQFPPAFHYLPAYFNEEAQAALLSGTHAVLAKAPLFQQTMPRTGAPLSVRMSNAGGFGWVSDREGGYRYETRHPVTGEAWPPIPERLLKLWTDLTSEVRPSNLCLINYYDKEARLGLHQDRGELVSLVDEATFVLGGLSRKNPVRR